MASNSAIKRPLLVVASLGNPEPQFSRTRHSIGHELLNAMSLKWRKGANGVVMGSSERYNNVIFMKSQGYMNVSGTVLAPAWRSIQKALAPKASLIRYLVIHDELSKELGKYQLRYGNVSSRGHNGLKSLVECYGNDFYRFGVGIDRPSEKSGVVDYVLGHYSNQEWEKIQWGVVPELEKTIETLRTADQVNLHEGKLK